MSKYSTDHSLVAPGKIFKVLWPFAVDRHIRKGYINLPLSSVHISISGYTIFATDGEFKLKCPSAM